MSAATPQDYRDLFEVDARGRRVLEHLERVFVKPPVLTGGIDAVLQTYSRAGQRTLLDFIHAQIARASSGPNDTPEAEASGG